MDRSIAFALILIVTTGVAYYFWQEHQARELISESGQAKTIELPAESTGEASPPPVRYPVPERIIPLVEEEEIEVEVEASMEEPGLPALDGSDAVLQGALETYFEPARLQELLVFRDFIRHIVVTIDNLDARKLPRRFMITRTPGSKFGVGKSGKDDEFILAEENYKRYSGFIALSEALGNRQLVSIYVKYYPLFQEAYDELGYRNRYFNDRLVEVIDHLLEKPDMPETIILHQPKVYYQFVDPRLEQLSTGQKILVRIGSENAERVRNRLVALRKLLVQTGS